MTKIVCKNERMLDTVISEIYRTLEEKKEVYVDFGEPYKPKTKKQLGFYFGAIVDSIIDFMNGKGIVYNQNEVKENFYQAISPKKTIRQFNGKEYEVPKHISDFDRKEMSEFIDKSIWLCENAHAFAGLVLHPSIKYTWIQHIDASEIRHIDISKFPRKCPEYLEHTRKQACICCGCQNRTEAHHLKEAGKSGVAYKVDDWEDIPLCKNCHRDYHIKGKGWFESQMQWLLKYMSLEDFCVINFNRWLNKW